MSTLYTKERAKRKKEKEKWLVFIKNILNEREKERDIHTEEGEQKHR
jgi:hypothetical protein